MTPPGNNYDRTHSNDTTEASLAAQVRGFHVFPLLPFKKLPAVEKFEERREYDEAKWWRTGHNVGISTSSFGENGKYLLAVDIDVKNGARGLDSFSKLIAEGHTFPNTYEQSTPSGGVHLVYWTRTPFSNGTNVLGPGIDIRGKGGFIVGAGSVLPEGSYTIRSDESVAEAPAWLLAKCKPWVPKEARRPKILGIDPDRAWERGLRYLRNRAEDYEPGRNVAGYSVAAKLKDFGCDESDTFGLMSQHWRCSPPLELDELEHVVKSAFTYGRNPQGSSAPEASFPDDDPISMMNREFGYVLLGSNGMVLQETTDDEGQFKLEYRTTRTFHELRPWDKYTPPGSDKPEQLSKAWIKHERRRTYDGVVFCPGKEVDKRFYNLWRGFSVRPVPATPGSRAERAVARWKEHLVENFCHGSEELVRSLTGYFAHLVQLPGVKPLTAPVFRGGKGVGKNALVIPLERILGKHALITSDRRYLTSNFNAHLERLLLLVLDEAHWPGDKSAEGVLKGLITGRKHLIERKGQEAYEVQNLTRVVIIGNEEWLVPASSDERRYAVYNVGEGKKQKRDYFQGMMDDMEADGGLGLAALLHYLLNYDLREVDVNAIPHTEGLLEQKLQTLKGMPSWWLDCLAAGKILHSDLIDEWPKDVRKDTIREAFARSPAARSVHSSQMGERSLGHAFTRFFPIQGLISTKIRKGSEAHNAYRLPELHTCRYEFEQYIGQKVDWKQYEEAA